MCSIKTATLKSSEAVSASYLLQVGAA